MELERKRERSRKRTGILGGRLFGAGRALNRVMSGIDFGLCATDFRRDRDLV